MKILELLKNAHVAVILDTHHGGQLGAQIGAASIAAIKKGRNSAEWKSYMSLFADNEAQLSRLTDQIDVGYLPKGQAYIVANGTCGADTNTFTENGVLPEIDDAANPGAPDGKVVDPPGPNPPDPAIFVRPFVVPRIP